jgi:hypothetical protein
MENDAVAVIEHYKNQCRREREPYETSGDVFQVHKCTEISVLIDMQAPVVDRHNENGRATGTQSVR